LNSTFVRSLVFRACLERPRISTNASHIFISPGNNIELICYVIDQAFPNIRWFKDNQPVKRLDHVDTHHRQSFAFVKVIRHRTNSHGHLLIRLASVDDDTGNYTCQVHNSVGSSSAFIRLDVGGRRSIICHCFRFVRCIDQFDRRFKPIRMKSTLNSAIQLN
jgi:hypothetical protein